MDVQYFGLFLNEESSNLLLDFIAKDAPDEMYSFIGTKKITLHLHHCTLLHKSQYNDNEHIYSNIAALHNIVYPNKSIPLIVDELGWSDKAIAFKCRSEIINLNGVCANKIPHITAYTINDGKPVDSNYITNWIPIIPMTVFARLYFVI